MKIKYRGEEYELVSETSGISYVHLMFSMVDHVGGVALLTFHYHSFGRYGKLDQNWIYLPGHTLHELVDIVKDHSRQVALK